MISLAFGGLNTVPAACKSSIFCRMSQSISLPAFDRPMAARRCQPVIPIFSGTHGRRDVAALTQTNERLLRQRVGADFSDLGVLRRQRAGNTDGANDLAVHHDRHTPFARGD